MAKPTDVNLLDPNTYHWSLYNPVTTADTFEGQTSNLNEEGLYSTTIFGRQGTKQRDERGAYIDVKLPIFNPTFYHAMVSLKSLYADIIKGKVYAIWDKDEKDFIKSNVIEGETGFSFFVSHLGELEPKETDSFRRKKKIKLIKEKRDIALTSKIITIPAGLRDIDFLPDGTISEQEINDLYRKLIFRTKSLTNENIRIDSEDPLYDSIRWGLQDSFNNIDSYLANMFKGKNGFFQRKVIRRSIFNATRNVITARHVSLENCDDDSTVDINSVLLGLYQVLLGFAPINVHALTNGILSRIFTSGINTANLLNTKTLEPERVDVDSRIVEKWITYEGLIKLFSGYGNPQFRNRVIIINNHYLCLTYDDGVNVGLFQSKEDLPEGFDPKFLSPTTYTELFYMECCPLIESKLMQLTRYPIEGLGSIFPSKPIIKPFNSGNGVRVNIADDFRYRFFPVRTQTPSWMDGMAISPAKYRLSGSDNDGDALSANSIMADDSIQEAYALFDKRSYYISSSDAFLYDPVVETHEFLLRALTL